MQFELLHYYRCHAAKPGLTTQNKDDTQQVEKSGWHEESQKLMQVCNRYLLPKDCVAPMFQPDASVPIEPVPFTGKACQHEVIYHTKRCPPEIYTHVTIPHSHTSDPSINSLIEVDTIPTSFLQDTLVNVNSRPVTDRHN